MNMAETLVTPSNLQREAVFQQQSNKNVDHNEQLAICFPAIRSQNGDRKEVFVNDQPGIEVPGIEVSMSGKSEQRSTSCIKNTAENANGRFTTLKYDYSFNKVNGMCINFTKSLTCDDQNNYKATLQIGGVKYFGKGSSGDEANENAAKKYLHSIDIGMHQKLMVCRKEPLNDVVPNPSFIKLIQMRAGDLRYLTTVCQDDDNMFKTVIQLDFINYYGTGKTIQSAANSAAETCLQSIHRGLHYELVSGI